MLNPVVSVIVPIYNVEAYLNECIKSIIAQTYELIEIILVDDGSPDACPRICEEWAKRDKRVAVIHTKNGGLSSARNAGLHKAKGEYILFVDADDVIDHDLIRDSLRQIKLDCSEVCVFRFRKFANDVSRSYDYKEASSFPTESPISSENAIKMLLEQRIHNYAQLRITKTELYRRIAFQFPLGRTMEDMATTAYVLGSANRVSCVNAALYYYRQREGSIVSEWSHERSIDTELALNDMTDFIGDSYPKLNTKVVNYAIKLLFYCWMNEPRFDKSDIPIKKRREKIAEEIEERIQSIDKTNVDIKNIIKYILLRMNLLGPLAHLHEMMRTRRKR